MAEVFIHTYVCPQSVLNYVMYFIVLITMNIDILSTDIANYLDWSCALYLHCFDAVEQQEGHPASKN